MATSESRKRPSPAGEGGNDAISEGERAKKRQRTDTTQPALDKGKPPKACKSTSSMTTIDELAKKGLRRGIALALNRVGFDSAAPEAMESFVAMTEMYLSSLADDIHAFATAARRTTPVVTDFEATLKRFNLRTSLLQPHRKPPIPRSKRLPIWEPLPVDDPIHGDLPILGPELDGAPEKNAKSYIPASFPAFPSIHTYRSTPENAESVMADPWNAFASPRPVRHDISPIGSFMSQGTTLVPGGSHLDDPLLSPATATSPRQQLDPLQATPPSQRLQNVPPPPPIAPRRPLAPDEIPRGDPKKMREAAAKEAKAGEEALRRLMRASKMATQKQAWASAQREPLRRERHSLWEAAMRDMISEDAAARGKQQQINQLTMHGEVGKLEVADHSMAVNADRRYHRREVTRSGVGRNPGGGGGGGAGGGGQGAVNAGKGGGQQATIKV